MGDYLTRGNRWQGRFGDGLDDLEPATAIEHQNPSGGNWEYRIEAADYNLFFRHGGRAIPFFRGWGATTYGTIESWQEETGNDRNSILAEPRFIDLDRRDFRPASGSPNIGHVQPHMSVRFDADGTLRPRSSASTTGAYEAVGENDR